MPFLCRYLSTDITKPYLLKDMHSFEIVNKSLNNEWNKGDPDSISKLITKLRTDMSAAVYIWKTIDIIATWQSQNEVAKWFNSKVHIFWEGHKILRNLHQLFDWQTAVHRTNNWWKFRKILWPSQNIWT